MHIQRGAQPSFTMRVKAGRTPAVTLRARLDALTMKRRIREAAAFDRYADQFLESCTFAGTAAAKKRLHDRWVRQELFRNHMAGTKAICEQMAKEMRES